MKGFLGLAVFLLAFCEPHLLVKGCPSDDLIYPCLCRGRGMFCSDVRNAEELRKALSSGFQEPVEFYVLEISGSPITALTSDVFRPIKSEIFSIKNNPNLTYIDEDTFSGTEDFIRRLEMWKNDIEGVDIFVAMSKMRSLVNAELMYNSLTSVPARALKSMRELIWVDLSHNRISRLGREAFADCPKLRAVNLSNNHLRVLPGRLLAEDSFVPVSPEESVTLYLNYNYIDEIEPDALEGIEKKIDIRLTNNSLQILERESFKPFLDRHLKKPETSRINLLGNPIFCDCRMQWIVDNPRYFKHFLFLICSNTNKYLHLYSPKELGHCLL